jgi:hypothetical protein
MDVNHNHRATPSLGSHIAQPPKVGEEGDIPPQQEGDDDPSFDLPPVSSVYRQKKKEKGGVRGRQPSMTHDDQKDGFESP